MSDLPVGVVLSVVWRAGTERLRGSTDRMWSTSLERERSGLGCSGIGALVTRSRGER